MPDCEVDNVLRILVDTVRTGRIGDGKIWVMPVDTVRGVRTGIQDKG